MRLSWSRTQGGVALFTRQAAGEGLVVAEGVAHLVAGDVGGLGGLLDGHAEFDDVEEELQQVLVLGVAALDREDEVGLAVLQRQRRESGSRAGACRARARCRDSRAGRARSSACAGESPMPVWPAITAGGQPPARRHGDRPALSSAASTLVVPNRKVRSNSAMRDRRAAPAFCCASLQDRVRVLAALVGIGVPGRMSGSL